jgi:hypothetical protein
MTVVEFPADRGLQVFVEIPGRDADGGLSRAGAGERVSEAAVRTWEQALEGMRAAAEGALVQLRRIDPPPAEVKVSFGVAVNGKLGATLVSAAADAHLKVEVTWRSEPGAASGSEQSA